MNISPQEAQEALADINITMKKARHSFAQSGIDITLIITGVVWLLGYTATQFLSGSMVVTIWIIISVIGSLVATFLGMRKGKKVRDPSASLTAKRILFFWLMLALFCMATILITHPTDGKVTSLIIIFFIMIGQLSMGLLISFSSTWWAIPIAALALVGYLFFPEYFYLWVALVGGGGMILFGLLMRYRW